MAIKYKSSESTFNALPSPLGNQALITVLANAMTPKLSRKKPKNLLVFSKPSQETNLEFKASGRKIKYKPAIRSIIKRGNALLEVITMLKNFFITEI